MCGQNQMTPIRDEMQSMKQGVSSAVFLLCTFALADVYSITVTTDVGDIIGFEDRWGSRKLHKFRGIPYAEAPIGDLRFRAPVAKAPFTEPFHADRFGPACLYITYGAQLVFSKEKQNQNHSEDCLSLNIYVPDGGETKKAVMVWIHGGGFSTGSGMQYDGSKIAAFGDVIVVTINYRLGLFGLLTTGDENAPGNYALLDQQMALKWVNKNIGAFGGDKDRVTIFGESAGAISVTWQMLAPSNQGLFHRVIAESGTPYNAGTFPQPEVTKRYTNRLVENLGCAKSDTKQVISCLRRLPADVFTGGFFLYPYYETFAERPPVGPRVDGNFIPYSPESRVPSSRLEDQPFFRSLDLLIGTNRYEGSPFMSIVRPYYMATMNHDINDGVTKDVFRSCVNFWATKGNYSTSAFWWFYGTSVNGNTKELMRPQELLEFISDALFRTDTIKFAKRHAAKTSESVGSTFMYSFLPSPSKSLGGIGELMKPSPWVDGAKHTDDLLFLFGVNKNEEKMTKGEADLSDAMTTYWTNFAKTGDPNKQATVPYQWPGYKVGEEKFIVFDIKNQHLNLSTNAFYRNRAVSFWHDVIPLVERSRAESD